MGIIIIIIIIVVAGRLASPVCTARIGQSVAVGEPQSSGMRSAKTPRRRRSVFRRSRRSRETRSNNFFFFSRASSSRFHRIRTSVYNVICYRLGALIKLNTNRWISPENRWPDGGYKSTCPRSATAEEGQGRPGRTRLRLPHSVVIYVR